jgi:DNA repair photolyase
MKEERKQQRGRGVSSQPQNRFTSFERSAEEEETGPSVRTTIIEDRSQSILAQNNSPDISFRYSLNPYRGCEHGCVYCYARPTHEYLGYSAGLDFETKIVVKRDAASLLEKVFRSPTWRPEPIVMSGVTDCYQPLERELRLTRACLEVFARFRNPVSLITKNYLITRDLDLLQELAQYQAVSACISLTTLDSDLCATLEPRTSRPQYRLRAIEALAKAGVPVSVNIAPLIPGLTDTEMPQILEAAYNAGARSAHFIALRLPLAVAGLFQEWIEREYPDRAKKVLNQLRSLNEGNLYKSQFGQRMKGSGIFAENIHQLFELTCRKLGMNRDERGDLSNESFAVPFEKGAQTSFF